MSIVVGYAATDEGRAALARAVTEATLRGTDVLVVQSSRGGTWSEQDAERAEEDLAEARAALDASGVQYRVHPRSESADPAEDIISMAGSTEADLIVIGLRRRTPVGKLILGSNAQRILLDAPCPVLAVKPAPASS